MAKSAIPQIPSSRCEQCSKYQQPKECHFDIWGKSCAECDGLSKGCRINGIAVAELWRAYMDAFPDAQDKWEPPVFSTPVPERREARERRKKEEKKVESVSKSDAPGRRVSRQAQARSPLSLSKKRKQQSSLGYPEETPTQNPRPGSVVTKLASPCYGGKSAPGQSLDISTISTRPQRVRKPSRRVLEGASEAELDTEESANDDSPRDMVRLKQVKSLKLLFNQPPSHQPAQHMTKSFAPQEFIPWEQFHNSIFPRYEDTTQRMASMRELEMGLWNFGAQNNSSSIGKAEEDISQRRPPAMCCGDVICNVPGGVMNTARATEVFFAKHLGKSAPSKAFEAERCPNWWKASDVGMRLTVLDRGDSNTSPRWFILRKGGNSIHGSYELCEMLTEQSPCIIISEEDSWRSGSIPDDVNEWFMRRAGTDVACPIHHKNYSVVLFEHYIYD